MLDMPPDLLLFALSELLLSLTAPSESEMLFSLMLLDGVGVDIGGGGGGGGGGGAVGADTGNVGEGGTEAGLLLGILGSAYSGYVLFSPSHTFCCC